jgi:hypothetical protein
MERRLRELIAARLSAHGRPQRERCLKRRLSLDLAANIADNPAEAPLSSSCRCGHMDDTKRARSTVASAPGRQGLTILLMPAAAHIAANLYKN